MDKKQDDDKNKENWLALYFCIMLKDENGEALDSSKVIKKLKL